MKREVERTDSDTSQSTSSRGRSSTLLTVTGRNGTPSYFMFGAHRPGAVDGAARRGLAARPGRALEAAQQPPQRLLEVGPLVLVDGLGPRGGDLAALDLALELHQPLEVLLEPLRQAGQQGRQALAQRGEAGAELRVVEVALLGHRLVEPAQQHHLLGDRELGVELQAGSP